MASRSRTTALRKRVEAQVAEQERLFGLQCRLGEETDPRTAASMLLQASQVLKPDQYDDIVTERSSGSGICGFMLCGEELKATPERRMWAYRISLSQRCVYDASELKKFCAMDCFQHSQLVRASLSSTNAAARGRAEREESMQRLLALDCVTTVLKETKSTNTASTAAEGASAAPVCSGTTPRAKAEAMPKATFHGSATATALTEADMPHEKLRSLSVVNMEGRDVTVAEVEKKLVVDVTISERPTEARGVSVPLPLQSWSSQDRAAPAPAPVPAPTSATALRTHRRPRVRRGGKTVVATKTPSTEPGDTSATSLSARSHAAAAQAAAEGCAPKALRRGNSTVVRVSSSDMRSDRRAMCQSMTIFSRLFAFFSISATDATFSLPHTCAPGAGTGVSGPSAKATGAKRKVGGGGEKSGTSEPPPLSAPSPIPSSSSAVRDTKSGVASDATGAEPEKRGPDDTDGSGRERFRSSIVPFVVKETSQETRLRLQILRAAVGRPLPKVLALLAFPATIIGDDDKDGHSKKEAVGEGGEGSRSRHYRCQRQQQHSLGKRAWALKELGTLVETLDLSRSPVPGFNSKEWRIVTLIFLLRVGLVLQLTSDAESGLHRICKDAQIKGGDLVVLERLLRRRCGSGALTLPPSLSSCA